MIVGVLVLSAGAIAATEEPPVSAVAAAEDGVARQARIYREALLQGSTEKVRVDAAVGLLLNKDTISRDFLVSSLRLPDNPGAGKAVCQALIESYAIGTTIGSQEMFLEPLMERLAGSDVESARLAAEALLVFRFEDIQARLDALLHDSMLDKRVRTSVIYALQVRSEPQALGDLIKLLDDPDTEMFRLTEIALQETFGVPVGTARSVWEQILDDLKQKRPDDIRRERLLRQEMKLRKMQTERDQWQKLYLGAMDKQYEAADETLRTAMVLERLDSDLPEIRLWSLDKIERYPVNGQATLRDKLLMLLGDESRLVRLKTARVLNNMSALNPAEKLLERLGVEKDAEVSLAMFEALGEACFFAFSPGSKIELPAGVKLQTLEIAVAHLDSDDAAAVQKGAEIIYKLLELNNLPQEQAVGYLERLVKRYQASVQQNSTLRGELLGVMAKLCDRGVQRERAAKMYLPYFVEGIQVADNPSARLAAAAGLSNIDKTQALELYKQNNLIQEGSPALRQIIIDAAGQVGQPEDLEWLAIFLTSNGQLEQALQAFDAICQRSPGQVSAEWAGRLDEACVQAVFVRELYELAEQKAMGEKNERLLTDVRVQLAEWFVLQQMPEQLAAYLERLKAAGNSLVFPDATGARLLEVLVNGGYYALAAEIVKVRLERESLLTDSAVLAKLDEFFKYEQINAEAKVGLLKKLAALKVSPANPLWSSRIKVWKDQFKAEPVAVPVLDPNTAEKSL